MLDTSFIKGLKQTNVSVDSAKTKERLSAVWKTCGKDGRQRMADMVDGAVSTYHTAVLKGKLSVKLAIPAAIVANVDPAYLTAETDEPSSCTDERIDDFLASHGYARQASGAAPVQKRRGRRSSKAQAGAARLSAQEAAELFSEDEGIAEIERIPVITWTEDAADEGIADAVFDDPEVAELLAMADEKIASFDPAKFMALDDFSSSDIEVLLRALEIRMNASDNARILMRLVRLLLV